MFTFVKVPLRLLWAMLTTFAASTARGMRSDALRDKETGNGFVLVNPDQRPEDIDVYFVPAADFVRIFPPGLKDQTTAQVEAIIADSIAASTEKVTIPYGLTMYIDSVEEAVAELLRTTELKKLARPKNPPIGMN